jgi:hypothetical protein
MALNPHFLQGSRGEQRLVQSLINEHLKIYGVEVTFIPRKFVNQSTIIEEVTASKFDDAYPIEAYIDNFDGYGDNPTKLSIYAMTKTYLEDINFLLTTQKQIRFNQRQDRLYMDIDWGNVVEGDYIIMDCYRAMNPNDYGRVWNDSFLKKTFFGTYLFCFKTKKFKSKLFLLKNFLLEIFISKSNGLHFFKELHFNFITLFEINSKLFICLKCSINSPFK